VILFAARDDDSGADRIARTIPYAVIAELDPAIHGAAQRSFMDVIAFGASAWTGGSSPVVTVKGKAARVWRKNAKSEET
jgi:hypothetical protein